MKKINRIQNMVILVIFAIININLVIAKEITFINKDIEAKVRYDLKKATGVITTEDILKIENLIRKL